MNNELSCHDLCYKDQNGDYVVPEEYALALEQKVQYLQRAIEGWWHSGSLQEYSSQNVVDVLEWWPDE